MAENPAGNHGVVHDTQSRSGGSPHYSVSGMGTEGQAIGVVTMLNVVEEGLPPKTRTSQEPDGEWLK
jgi:hypothetical protein